MFGISRFVFTVAVAATILHRDSAVAQVPLVPTQRAPVTTNSVEPPVSYSLLSEVDEANERRILDALTKPISVDWKSVPLKDVLAFLAKECNITIVLTKKIEDAGVTPDEPITRSFNKVPLRSALRQMLGDLNLTFLVKDHALRITTDDGHGPIDNQIIRLYPVKDLAKVVKSKDGKSTWDFDPLIGLIEAIEPDSWRDVGGPGVVKGFENGGCLFISQREDVHERIERLLITLRRVKKEQGLKDVEQTDVPNRYLKPVPKVP
jgi:hypothetical protein